LAGGESTLPSPHQDRLAAKGELSRDAWHRMHYIYPARERELAEKISTHPAHGYEFPMDHPIDKLPDAQSHHRG